MDNSFRTSRTTTGEDDEGFVAGLCAERIHGETWVVLGVQQVRINDYAHRTRVKARGVGVCGDDTGGVYGLEHVQQSLIWQRRVHGHKSRAGLEHGKHGNGYPSRLVDTDGDGID